MTEGPDHIPYRDPRTPHEWDDPRNLPQNFHGGISDPISGIRPEDYDTPHDYQERLYAENALLHEDRLAREQLSELGSRAIGDAPNLSHLFDGHNDRMRKIFLDRTEDDIAESDERVKKLRHEQLLARHRKWLSEQ
jgi:hypothetical protein